MGISRILVVEDERIVAASLCKRLQNLGYDVPAVAHTGADALVLTEQLRPDLVLMDIRLEGEMDGVQAATEIRSRFQIPVVYLTAYSNKEVLDRAKVTAPYGYILKPYEDRELHVVVETALAKHRSDRQLQQRERWLATILKSIGDGVLALSPEGRVTFLNALAEQLTGWTSEEASGLPLAEVFQLMDAVTHQPIQPLQPAGDQTGTLPVGAAGPGRPGLTVLLAARNGTHRLIEACTTPLADEGGANLGSVLVFRDLTERKKLEEQLLQAQKMEAMGRLAGGVAHDFNNVLTVVNCYSELLLRILPSQDQSREYAAEIAAAGKRAAGLTQQLLAYSRKQVLHPRVIEVNELVNSMKQMLTRVIGEDIELSTTLTADRCQVLADPTQVEQVIMNLCVNARDAMPTGGKLAITTDRVNCGGVSVDKETGRPGDKETLEGPSVSLSPGLPVSLPTKVQPGAYIRIAVTDSGCGMDAETQAHIFDPFFTTKDPGKGVGLGLATVQGVVQQSGGTIQVQSTPGQGTTFTVYLPAVETSQQAAGLTDVEDVPGGSETILVVEDEDSVRELTQLLLYQLGYRTLAANNGLQAVELAARHQGAIHLLLTDVVLPLMSGPQAAHALRLWQPNIRVLFMSGYTEDARVRHGISESEIAFLQKPFTVAALATKVREVLDGPASSVTR